MNKQIFDSPLTLQTDTVHNPPPGAGVFCAIEGPSLPPDGYKVTLHNGYYYALRLEAGDKKHVMSRLYASGSPLEALDPHQDASYATTLAPLRFTSYTAAVDYCWEEFFTDVGYQGAIERVMHWQNSFVYSDRVTECQQFLEAITGEQAQFWSSTGCAIASVGPFLWSPRPFFLTAWRETIEEALVDLYEQVYALARSVLKQAEDEAWLAWWEAGVESQKEIHPC
jgi:hypothetical protein